MEPFNTSSTVPGKTGKTAVLPQFSRENYQLVFPTYILTYLLKTEELCICVIYLWMERHLVAFIKRKIDAKISFALSILSNHAGLHRSVLTHFQLFAWFGQTLFVRKMGKYLNFSFWIPLDPKLIFNDQVGSVPCAHTKFLSATRCKVNTGQKMSRQTDFQWLKSGIFSNLS